MKTAAILGASGYAGGELVRLLDGHPGFDLVHLGAHTSAGERLGEIHPHLTGGDRVLGTNDPDAVMGVDIVFMALPHGASADTGVALVNGGSRVVDLGSDFRMDTPERYLEAYGSAHPHPDQLAGWAFGLPELFASDIIRSAGVAAPGCYPTSAILALAPLVSAGLVDPSSLIVDSLSGVSGAGRSLKPNLLFGAVDESVAAYAVTTHRHRPEMEQAISAASGRTATVVFTPHLVPMQRGILSTCYAQSIGNPTRDDIAGALEKAYGDAPFVSVIDQSPQTRWVSGSNRALIAPYVDERTGTVVVVSAIDNLLKGAAGQGVQCANIMFGFDETAGLPMQGWMP